MRSFVLDAEDDFEGWRDAARQALIQGLAPEAVSFTYQQNQGSLLTSLLDEPLQNNGSPNPIVSDISPTVPSEFIQLAKLVTCHSAPRRFALLYRVLVRIQSEKTLLRKSADEDIHSLAMLAKEVRRDMHKMKAFVRFRKTGTCENDIEQFVAWFEPTHHCVRLTAPFFKRRFANMHWSILTPSLCAHWNCKTLSFTAGVPKSHAPEGDVLEDYWKSYYASIFNPARLKVDAMTSEMPKKYWKNLPEAELIPDLIRRAKASEKDMLEARPSQPKQAMMQHQQSPFAQPDVVPSEIDSMVKLNNALHGCRLCPLWKGATQSVCGSGPKDADIMLVGEQPGDMEDLQGAPFIGPAGKLLHEVISGVGLKDPYLTNAVKHFKFEPRGKRRIHKSPSMGEIDHCRWWLHKEIEFVRPKIIVALGASAIRGILGKSGSVSAMRGEPIDLSNGSKLVVSRHPSSILRISDSREKADALHELTQDLAKATSLVPTV